MFTGLVQARGVVHRSVVSGMDLKLVIDLGELGGHGTRIGDSVAIDGVCLTVVERTDNECCFHVSRETIAMTLLGSKVAGEFVNLELALLPTTRIGGHFVTGHIDGIAQLEKANRVGDSTCMMFKLPAELARFVARKGSVCIDGVSLTVNAVDGLFFEVNIIPHTLQNTTMESYRAGTKVHLEIDIVARYLDRLMSEINSGETTSPGTFIDKVDSNNPLPQDDENEEIDEAFLSRQGFLAPDIGE